MFLLVTVSTRVDTAQASVSLLPRWRLRHRDRAGDIEVPDWLPAGTGMGAGLAARIPWGLDAGVGRVRKCSLCHKSGHAHWSRPDGTELSSNGLWVGNTVFTQSLRRLSAARHPSGRRRRWPVP